MIVISGHVSAPALAALTTSTPSRRPKSFVFHVGAAFCVCTGAAGITVDRATERSDTVAIVRVSCATASRVILMREFRGGITGIGASAGDKRKTAEDTGS